jgi:uncharacterized iron-regulated membrane protein
MAYSTAGSDRRGMSKGLSLLLTMLAFSVAPPLAARDDEAASARAATAQGQALPLGRLVAMVQARPPYRDMVYLGGPKFDARTMRYDLKFLDRSRVIVVQVDARTGRVLGQQP